MKKDMYRFFAKANNIEQEQKLEGYAFLSDEILLKIFSYIFEKDLGRVASTCKSWKRVSNTPELWKQFAQNEFPIFISLPIDLSTTDIKTLYRNTLIQGNKILRYKPLTLEMWQQGNDAWFDKELCNFLEQYFQQRLVVKYRFPIQSSQKTDSTALVKCSAPEFFEHLPRFFAFAVYYLISADSTSFSDRVSHIMDLIIVSYAFTGRYTQQQLRNLITNSVETLDLIIKEIKVFLQRRDQDIQQTLSQIGYDPKKILPGVDVPNNRFDFLQGRADSRSIIPYLRR